MVALSGIVSTDVSNNSQDEVFGQNEYDRQDFGRRQGAQAEQTQDQPFRPNRPKPDPGSDRTDQRRGMG